jgi:hypothetical protein
MELLITLGRDCVVAYQNEGSAKIDPLPVGTSIIKRTFVMSAEEVNWTRAAGPSEAGS